MEDDGSDRPIPLEGTRVGKGCRLESGLGFPSQESLVDEETKALVRLLKEQKKFPCPVLELQEAAQRLQLRERQFQEMVQKLQAHSSDKVGTTHGPKKRVGWSGTQREWETKT